MRQEIKSLTDRNNFLNFLKGIGCIGVVFIHVLFPGVFGKIIARLAAFAVPVFFLISGYYAFEKGGNVENTIRRRLKRIIRITVFSLVFYFVFFLGRLFFKHKLRIGLINMMTVKIGIKAIILGDFDFIGAGHLWFFIH